MSNTIQPAHSGKNKSTTSNASSDFLYYARVIDNTTLHALSDIATVTSKGTEATLASIEYFLKYAAINPDGRIRYTTNKIILQTISDAAYLVCPKARSPIGGYHFLGNKDRELFNGPLLVLAKIIKNVMGSAAESEVGALSINAQAALPIRQYVIETGQCHSQGHPHRHYQTKTFEIY